MWSHNTLRQIQFTPYFLFWYYIHLYIKIWLVTNSIFFIYATQFISLLVFIFHIRGQPTFLCFGTYIGRLYLMDPVETKLLTNPFSLGRTYVARILLMAIAPPPKMNNFWRIRPVNNIFLFWGSYTQLMTFFKDLSNIGYKYSSLHLDLMHFGVQSLWVKSVFWKIVNSYTPPLFDPIWRNK